MRKSKLVLLIIILAKFSLENFAQEIPEHFGYLKGQFHYGYIMQHRNSIGHLIEGRIKGFELNWAVQTKGDKVWHYENNFPEADYNQPYSNYDASIFDAVGLPFIAPCLRYDTKSIILAKNNNLPKLIEISDDLDDMMDSTDDVFVLREISKYQVLLNHLQIKMSTKE